MAKLRNDISSGSVTDEQTKATIKEIHDKYGILIEPHGAVGIRGLRFQGCTGDITLL
ncbi:MAG: hypothetical protein R2741_14315 [Methanolobus sp.]